ncbi:thioredoxin family protein [Pedosphaera parvula]|uniref:Thiol-disulfide isomerase or thioredoxin n=1 Tax=Pedosphaera parvula (strain Ellin514) TaxID=320771 RepID=B9XKW0_PEDPL|nr:thioredoxin family protein [Pedosphaera parvula]EEF59454.1 thiol-disulfide isomerase or thioredoxin [Pedosphaera parvula Ellin514]
MKRFIFGFVAVFWLAMGLAVPVRAAEAEWLTDFSKAQSKALTDKKMILMDFTGSDWCPPCQKLHENVFSKDEFIKFANSNLVLVVVDFPEHKELTQEQKKANQALSDKFKADEFPTVILLNSEGKELDRKLGEETTLKGFMKQLRKLQEKEKKKE